MKETTPKVITLYGDEARLLRAAEAAELEIIRRDQTPPGEINPFIVPETQTEKSLLAERIHLEKKYFQQCGSDQEIILVAGSDSTDAELPSLLTAQSETNIETIAPNQSVPFFGAFASGIRLPYLPPVSSKYCQDGELRATDLNLEQIFIERTQIKRVNEDLYMFNGKHYSLLSDNALQTQIRLYLRDVLGKRGDASQLNAIETFVKTEHSILVTDPGVYRHLICLENGVLNLRTGELLPHSDQYFLTWMLKTSWIEQVDCPVFREFLNTVSGGEPELQQRILEVLGYILSPDNDLKKFILLQGLGDTGKSVLGNLISSFFDEDQVGGTDIFRLGERFALQGLVSKRVNVSMDLPRKIAVSETSGAALKQITGGDTIQIEAKYKNPYSTKIDCKLVFGSNHALKLDEADPALVNRVLLIPFRFPVPYHLQDEKLLDKLQAEKAGIFRLSLIAYRRFRVNGRVFAGEDQYGIHAGQIGDQAQIQEDGLKAFAQEHITESEGFVPTEFLYRSYLEYGTANHYPLYTTSQSFSAALGSMLAQWIPSAVRKKKRVEGKSLNGFSGIQMI